MTAGGQQWPADRVDALITAQAERTPDAVAVVCGGRSLTYGSLLRDWLSGPVVAGVIGTSKFSDYITGSWKHFVAHPRSVENIERIAEVVRGYDVVALQEVDGGSHRSGYVNQVEHLAQLGAFPYWYQQLNRNLGRLGQHSNGVLARYGLRPSEFAAWKAAHRH